jgi:hypothetical protein
MTVLCLQYLLDWMHRTPDHLVQPCTAHCTTTDSPDAHAPTHAARAQSVDIIASLHTSMFLGAFMAHGGYPLPPMAPLCPLGPPKSIAQLGPGRASIHGRDPLARRTQKNSRSAGSGTSRLLLLILPYWP